jgi:F0F1-type ATP synthase gamma subunit
MVAMKGATENADEMAGSLKQQYNRARQAGITSELGRNHRRCSSTGLIII